MFQTELLILLGLFYVNFVPVQSEWQNDAVVLKMQLPDRYLPWHFSVLTHFFAVKRTTTKITQC